MALKNNLPKDSSTAQDRFKNWQKEAKEAEESSEKSIEKVSFRTSKDSKVIDSSKKKQPIPVITFTDTTNSNVDQNKLVPSNEDYNPDLLSPAVSPGDSISHSGRNALSNSSEKSEESSIGIDDLDPNRLMRGASTLRRYAGQLIESADNLAKEETEKSTTPESRKRELEISHELQKEAIALFNSQIGIDELAKALQEREIDHNGQKFEKIWGDLQTSENLWVKSVISVVKRQSIIHMRQKRQS